MDQRADFKAFESEVMTAVVTDRYALWDLTVQGAAPE